MITFWAEHMGALPLTSCPEGFTGLILDYSFLWLLWKTFPAKVVKFVILFVQNTCVYFLRREKSSWQIWVGDPFIFLC